MNIKEIALMVARNMADFPIEHEPYEYQIKFAKALIAELQKQNEPVGYFYHAMGGILPATAGYEHDDEVFPLFTFPPIPEPKWRSIESAPKVGAHLAWEDGKRPYVIVWLDADHPDADGAGWYEHWNFDPVNPTHWLPLPEAPKGEEK